MDEQEFISRIHELHSPLSAIMRWINRLGLQSGGRQLDNEQAEAIAYIRDYCQAMLDLIPRLTLNLSDSMETISLGHKFGGPIGGIVGFSFLLLQEKSGLSDAKQRSYLEKIESAGRYLNALYLELLNDLQDREIGAKP